MFQTTSQNSARSTRSHGQAFSKFRSLPAGSLLPARSSWVTAVVLVLGWSTAASAQTCPSGYSACDNTGCCLSSEQCCPTLAEGCCASATPYCCGDGTCAATPSQCGAISRGGCDGYDVPCGNGCAPAGSDCCDIAGHYCPPESMCTSDTTCVRGSMPTIALQVELPPESSAPGAQTVVPPYGDPGSATDRSCSLRSGAPVASREPLAWLVLAAGLAGLRGRRSTSSSRPR